MPVYTPSFEYYVEERNAEDPDYGYEAYCPQLNLRAFAGGPLSAGEFLETAIQERIEELLCVEDKS